jgi:RNA polymerase sigma-70 factor (ECF subfamily)
VAEQLAVREALAALPPRYRVPLVFYSAEGYATAEVADILELSTGAVKVRLYRARKKLRRAYRQQEQGVPRGASVTAVGCERGCNE